MPCSSLDQLSATFTISSWLSGLMSVGKVLFTLRSLRICSARIRCLSTSVIMAEQKRVINFSAGPATLPTEVRTYALHQPSLFAALQVQCAQRSLPSRRKNVCDPRSRNIIFYGRKLRAYQSRNIVIPHPFELFELFLDGFQLVLRNTSR